MKDYLKRVSDEVIERHLKSSGAVLIEGPKWCGKTTSAMQFSKTNVLFSDPQNKDYLKSLLTLNYKALFVGDPPILFDEWQLVPTLWDTVRFEVDNRQEPGQFILTGSTVPPDTKDIMHSGIGRIARMQMRSMSLFESKESTGEVSLRNLFESKEVIGRNKLELPDIAYIACRGGWPSSLNREKEYSLDLPFDYINALVNTDVSALDGTKRNKELIKKILKSYARNVATQASLETIRLDVIGSDDASTLSQTTLYEYINALSSLFVIEDSPAWNPNLRSKSAIRSTPTRYFNDPSIVTAALGLGPDDLIKDLNTFGFVFENLCVRDLRVYAQALYGTVYHYQDKNSLECDCVIHLRNGRYALIEVKLGTSEAINEGAQNLLKLKEKLDTEKMGEPAFLMVLSGIAPFAFKRDDGVYVVPIGTLGP